MNLFDNRLAEESGIL